jgi:predicted nucleotidyltransferase
MDAAASAVTRRSEEIAAIVQHAAQSWSQEGVVAMFLYGSALDRLFRPDSDLDIAVLDSLEHPMSWSDQARFMDTLERATGRGVDLRLLRESSLSHQAHVIEQGRIVWTRDPGAVERYTRDFRTAAHQAREGSELRWSQTLDRLAKTTAAR